MSNTILNTGDKQRAETLLSVAHVTLTRSRQVVKEEFRQEDRIEIDLIRKDVSECHD